MWVAIVALVWLTWAGPALGQEAPASRLSSIRPSPIRPPNILLVIADDLGVDQVGVYRESPDPPATPHLDALARRGVLFRNAWSYPVCSSTRATILTGRYGFRTGMGWVVTPGTGLPDREYTLPELLARHPVSPYERAAVGKWHLHGGAMWERDRRILSGPVRAGFPSFRGVFQYIAMRYDHWRELSVHDLGDGTVVIEHDRIVERYNTSEIVDRAGAWIRRTESPWFLWLAFNAAHSPFHVPPEALHHVDLSSQSVSCQNPFPYGKPEQLVPCYRAMVEAMDHELGRLLGEEIAPETLRDTIVIFVGDNGTPKEASSGDFAPMHAKGTPYEGGINVPLVVAGPGIAGGDAGAPRESTALVVTADLFATVLELAGLDVAAIVPARYPSPDSDEAGEKLRSQRRRSHRPRPGRRVVLDSQSLVSLLRNEPDARPRAFAYAELFGAGHGSPVWPEAQAIRDVEGYKLIRFPEQHFIRAHDELYHLPSDPFERRDLLRGEPTDAQRAAYRQLANELDAIRASGWRPDATGADTTESDARESDARESDGPDD